MQSASLIPAPSRIYFLVQLLHGDTSDDLSQNMYDRADRLVRIAIDFFHFLSPY